VSEAELIRQAIADAELVVNGLPFSSDSKDDTLASEQSNSEPEALQARAFIAAHQAILSPLRSLPAELLEAIFTYTRNPEKPRHVPRMPVVSQVCRKWRDVAESTPAIWSDITLDLRQVRTNARRREHHDVFGLMLDRSRQHPLRVHISASEAIPVKTRQFPFRISTSDLQVDQTAHPQLPFRINTSNPQVDQTAHPQLLQLFATSDRWTVATITISQCMPRADIESMLHRLHGQVPSLVSLEVTTDSLSPSALEESLCAAFADAPALREVSLCGPWGPTKFIFPWAQLTLYKDHWSTSLDFFALDLLKTSIKELHVLWRSWNTTMVTIQAGAAGLGGTEPMLFAQLEKLKVSFAGVSHRTLFPILIIPELREISLERYPGGHFSEITAMFARSCEPQVGTGVLVHRNLRSFTCNGKPKIFYQAGELENFLELVPYLQHLDVRLPNEDALRKLSILDANKILVPNLISLRFYVLSKPPITDSEYDCLRDLVSNRCERTFDDGILESYPQTSMTQTTAHHPYTPIKSFTIRFQHPYQNLGDLERLESGDVYYFEDDEPSRFLICRHQLSALFQVPNGRLIGLLSGAQLQAVNGAFWDIERWRDEVGARNLHVSSRLLV